MPNTPLWKATAAGRSFLCASMNRVTVSANSLLLAGPDVELLIARPDLRGDLAVLQHEVDRHNELDALGPPLDDHLLRLLDSVAGNEVGLVRVGRVLGHSQVERLCRRVQPPPSSTMRTGSRP